jgi:hypothetical protein
MLLDQNTDMAAELPGFLKCGVTSREWQKERIVHFDKSARDVYKHL